MPDPTKSERIATLRAELATLGPDRATEAGTELAAKREAIKTMAAERAELATYRRNRAELGAAIDAWVAGLANDTRTADHQLARIANGDPPNLLQVAVGVGSRLDLGPLLVSLLGAPAVANALKARIDAVVPALPNAAGRAARTAELGAQIDAAEIAEEALVQELEALGVAVNRRANASPLAVLGG